MKINPLVNLPLVIIGSITFIFGIILKNQNMMWAGWIVAIIGLFEKN